MTRALPRPILGSMTTVTFTDWLATVLAPPQERARPKRPARRTEPLLMGDILTTRLDRPELLIRWDREAPDDRD